MNYDRTLKIYEWTSYVLLLAATVVFFVMRGNQPLGTTLTLIILVVAMFMRMMMERTRRKSYEAENDRLKADLKHLTSLLKKEKKDN